MSLLEIACFSPEYAVLAAAAGADRIELCDEPQAGGTTPAFEGLLHVKANVSIPVYVMIRPRGGDFVYSDAEFDRMKYDLGRFKPRVDGFVFGVLTTHGHVDIERTTELVALASPLPCTFHRAFDETSDPLKATELIIASGCKAILTSGCKPSASQGLDLLSKLCRVYGHRIVIMPGGGVRSTNLAILRNGTAAQAFHSSAALHTGKPDSDEIVRMKVLLRSKDQESHVQTETDGASHLTVPTVQDEHGHNGCAVSVGGSTPSMDRDC